MKIKELEKKLNSITSDDLNFTVKEEKEKRIATKLNGDTLDLEQIYKGEIIIYTGRKKYKEELLKIMPPHKKFDFWYVDTETTACLFDTTALVAYINVLKIVLKFLEEKNKEK
ncbi:hypothetical protein DF212_03735 [Lactobacillus johnsonii]|nr:hypothetical protein DF212_03735 [Lactobacillus johnsonii]